MLRLNDIMSREVLAVDENLSMRDAMVMLASHHVSGAPVVAGKNVVGVISATDMLEFASGLPPISMERQGDREFDPEIDADEGPDGNSDFNYFYLDTWDDTGADSASRYSSVQEPEWNRLEQHTVSESMTRVPICSLPSSAPVSEAAEYMQRAAIHRILVIDAGKVVGIVTTTDIARAAAEGKLGKRVYVFPSRRDAQE